jgi:hypothetical protein
MSAVLVASDPARASGHLGTAGSCCGGCSRPAADRKQGRNSVCSVPCSSLPADVATAGLTLIYDEIGLPFLSPRTCTHLRQANLYRTRGVVRGHRVAGWGLLPHRQKGSFSACTGSRSGIRSLIRGKPKDLPFIQVQPYEWTRRSLATDDDDCHDARIRAPSAAGSITPTAACRHVHQARVLLLPCTLQHQSCRHQRLRSTIIGKQGRAWVWYLVWVERVPRVARGCACTSVLAAAFRRLEGRSWWGSTASAAASSTVSASATAAGAGGESAAAAAAAAGA